MKDDVLAQPLVTRGFDGDVWLGSGGTQKFLAVEFTHYKIQFRSVAGSIYC